MLLVWWYAGWVECWFRDVLAYCFACWMILYWLIFCTGLVCYSKQWFDGMPGTGLMVVWFGGKLFFFFCTGLLVCGNAGASCTGVLLYCCSSGPRYEQNDCTFGTYLMAVFCQIECFVCFSVVLLYYTGCTRVVVYSVALI